MKGSHLIRKSYRMISYVESHKEASHVLVYLWVLWTFCAVFLFYRNQILYVNWHSIAVHMNSVILSKSESCCSTELTARSRCSVMFVLLLNWGPEKKKVYTSASTSTLSLFSADTWKLHIFQAVINAAFTDVQMNSYAGSKWEECVQRVSQSASYYYQRSFTANDQTCVCVL